MEEVIQLIAKTYGIAGLIMLSPFVAVVFVWRHSILQGKELSRINEQRVVEARAIIDKLIIIVGEQSALNKETNIALERVGDMMSIMTSQQR